MSTIEKWNKRKECRTQDMYLMRLMRMRNKIMLNHNYPDKNSLSTIAGIALGMNTIRTIEREVEMNNSRGS